MDMFEDTFVFSEPGDTPKPSPPLVSQPSEQPKLIKSVSPQSDDPTPIKAVVLQPVEPVATQSEPGSYIIMVCNYVCYAFSFFA